MEMRFPKLALCRCVWNCPEAFPWGSLSRSKAHTHAVLILPSNNGFGIPSVERRMAGRYCLESDELRFLPEVQPSFSGSER